MNRSADEILSLYTTRRNASAKRYAVARTILKIIDGDYEITLPELNRSERNQVANLIQTGADQHAMRIASVLPTQYWPPSKSTMTARDAAEDKKLVVSGWWELNKMRMVIRKRARHLVALGTSPIYIRPGDGYPIWEVRDPLATFPSDDDLVPDNCIFTFTRTAGWLMKNYPDVPLPPLGRDAGRDTKVTLLQYCDADEFVLIAVGKKDDMDYAADQQTPTRLLQRVPNITGRPMVIIPGRITVGRLQGQFDQMIGMYESQGYLWAMHLHAIKRSIFPEEWLLGRPNENPQVVVQPDPYRGIVGVAEGGAFQEVKVDPGVQTLQSLDRQERNQRLTGDVPSEFGGESPSNVRTARRGGQVLSSAVDFPVQEHQEIIAISMTEENKAAIACAKAYWPHTEKELLVPYAGGNVTYAAADLFDTDDHLVEYAYAGQDTSGLVIEAGQLIGVGAFSAESLMEIHPMVKDVKREKIRIQVEGLERAHMSSIQQQAANPQAGYTPDDLAYLTYLIQDRQLPLYQAEKKLQDRIKKRQANAAQGQMTPDQMQPGGAQAGAPGTMQAAQPTNPSGMGPTQGQQGLAQLLMTLRGAQGAPLQRMEQQAQGG